MPAAFVGELPGVDTKALQSGRLCRRRNDVGLEGPGQRQDGQVGIGVDGGEELFTLLLVGGRVAVANAEDDDLLEAIGGRGEHAQPLEAVGEPGREPLVEAIAGMISTSTPPGCRAPTDVR